MAMVSAVSLSEKGENLNLLADRTSGSAGDGIGAIEIEFGADGKAHAFSREAEGRLNVLRFQTNIRLDAVAGKHAVGNARSGRPF